MRLNRFLSMAGISSRRKADALILEGRVSVNGKTVDGLGVKVNPHSDKVFVDEREVVILDEPVYILFNKPKDCITTSDDERGRTTVMDFVKVRERVFPIGRLDRNTTGVLLLTNDGPFANGLMHPRREVKKTYRVALEKPLAPQDARQLESGIRLPEGKTAPAQVSYIPGGKNMLVAIVIHEGRNRQVHRMFESLGYVIEKLDRVAYADISYEGLIRGEWRHLTKSEVRRLMVAAGMETGKT